MGIFKQLKRSLSDLFPWSKKSKKNSSKSKKTRSGPGNKTRLKKLATPQTKKTSKKARRVLTKTVKLAKKVSAPKPNKIPVKKQGTSKVNETVIGRVSHYFPKVHAAAAIIEKGTLKTGDTIHIQGNQTDFKQKILSMQINRIPIEIARKGEEIGIEVKNEVRENDRIYKIET